MSTYAPFLTWFIEKNCPRLYFDALDKFVALHYQCILVYARENIIYHFGRDFSAEWHEHLLATISEMSKQQNNLVVEGYLLYDCLDVLKAQMSQSAQVYLIHVRDKIYMVNGVTVTAGDIADIGRTDRNTA